MADGCITLEQQCRQDCPNGDDAEVRLDLRLLLSLDQGSSRCLRVEAAARRACA
jgi:hypothetical protein